MATAKAEAEFCLELMQGCKLELPVYYDVENSQRQGKLSKAQLTEIVETFCSTVEKAGYFVGWYSYTDWLKSKFDTAALSKKYTLWKADYRTNYDKTIACHMHQYTSGGKVAGINGRVDLSHCYRDFPGIIKNAGLNGFEKNSTSSGADVPPPHQGEDLGDGENKPTANTAKRFSAVATGRDLEAFKNLAESLSIKNYKIEEV